MQNSYNLIRIIITSSNNPRMIATNNIKDTKHLHYSSINDKDKKNFKWKPWGTPTPSSELVCMRVDFINRNIDDCLKDDRISKRPKKEFDEIPVFATDVLRYGELCELLNKELGETNYNESVRIDGCFNSDIWTYMCRDMKMGGIVDVGGSFITKSTSELYAFARRFNSYDNIRDSIDISFNHEKQVIAPYFHLTHSYMSEMFFDTNRIRINKNQERLSSHFSSSFGFHATQLALLWLVTQSTTDEKRKQLTDNIRLMQDIFNFDKSKLDNHIDEVIKFYKPQMKEYIQKEVYDAC